MGKRTRHLLVLLPFVAFWAAVAVAQTVVHHEKMSITTQMFLDEMAGNISFNEAADRQLGSDGLLIEPVRPFAAPEMIGGKAYIPSFVWVNAQDVIGQLEEA